MSSEEVRHTDEEWRNDPELIRQRLSKIGAMGGRVALHRGDNETATQFLDNQSVTSTEIPTD